MDTLPLLHQTLLFGHVIAFAVTMAAVLREDLRLLATRRIDPARLRRTMRTATLGLAVLWATGLGLVAIAAVTAPPPWAPGPKLAAKLVVVTLLTLNGWALHAWVFPRLRAGMLCWGAALRLPAALGAISTASWLYAAFVGVARPLAPVMDFAAFMGLYAAGIALALGVVRVVFALRPAHAAAG